MLAFCWRFRLTHHRANIENWSARGQAGQLVAASIARRSPAVRRADASSGRDRVVPASSPQLELTLVLAEHNSQQAGAQEQEAGRGQGKKSVGDNVVVAHQTPTTQMLVRIY
jgi:hypothetical protein